ncbi:MAG: SdiA-regulated domain-containing protein [Parvularculaceae bacterium]|nr:SdiA-regulated domain-containing protein [Parvularculaceae bacterium]
MKSPCLAAGAALAAAIVPADAADVSATLRPEGPPQRLAGALAEISGLAPAGGTHVYAHTDEEAKVFELDVRSGDVVRTFSLGRPAAVGDFEAVVARGGVIALVTSKGVIHEAALSGGARPLAFSAVDTGAGRDCEIEGLAPNPARDGYFLACKRKGRRLVVREWSRKDGLAPAIDMELQGAVPNPKAFRAADIVADQATRSLLVLDSAAGAILEVSLDGEKRGYWRLGGDHPQAEGLALLEDGRLLVADEGKIGEGSLGAGKLTLYPPRR